MIPLKAIAAKLFAARIDKKTKKWSSNPVKIQESLFNSLIENAKGTVFGKDHGFEGIKSHQDFVKAVPIRDYED